MSAIIKSIFIFMLLCISGYGSPHWSIETIHHDIMRAKEENHRIYEVQVASASARYLDTQIVDRSKNSLIYKCQNNCTGFDTIEVKIYQVELKVLSAITNIEHPNVVPLIVMDRRRSSVRYWQRVNDWIKQENPVFIAIVDRKSNLVALYPEKFQLGGDREFIKKMTPGIRKEIIELASSKDYADFVNLNNLIKVLNRAGL